MSVAAAQADAFYLEFLTSSSVYSIRDHSGYPAPMNPDGSRAMPFWSSRSRAQRIIDTVAAYREFQLVKIPADEWIAKWLPGLEADGLLVGLNWTGVLATGYDLSVAQLSTNLDARRGRIAK